MSFMNLSFRLCEQVRLGNTVFFNQEATTSYTVSETKEMEMADEGENFHSPAKRSRILLSSEISEAFVEGQQLCKYLIV